MYCPVCNSKETKVVDSRLTQEGSAVRRRRECIKCSYRFSTVEEMEILDVTVVKRNGRRETYSREKLIQGLLQSLAKRSYTQEKFERLINSIERDIQKLKKREIESDDLGEIVMKHLRRFDKIAYIRFASIYRDFQDVQGFEDEVQQITRRRRKKT